MNKKLIPLLTLLTLALIPMTLATPTELDMQWSGGGNIDAEFSAGDDAWIAFSTGGNMIAGNFYARDDNNNPYGYGVDNSYSKVGASVASGGFIEYQVDRTDSKESMYGPADQRSYSYIDSSDAASMAFSVGTNYASLSTSNYGFQANNHFTADGEYYATHRVDNGLNNAYFMAGGDGTLTINHMSDGSTTGSNFEFGRGSGSYTNADVYATGTGIWTLGAHAENGMTHYGSGWTAGGPITYTETVSFGDGFTWENYSFKGN